MVKAEVFGPDNYDSCAHRVKQLTGVLLIFHPGCGHCVQMRPAWEAMKQSLPPESKIVEVDGSALSESGTLRQLDVFQKLKGFPTIVRMKNGRPVHEFGGPRTAEAMIHFSRPMPSSRSMSEGLGRNSRGIPRGTRKGMKKGKRNTRKIDSRKKPKKK